MIFKNIYSSDKSTCALIDLSRVEAIFHLDKVRKMHRYKIVFKSGAVVEFEGVSLMKEWEEYNQKNNKMFTKLV